MRIQAALCLEVAKDIGFDMDRGRFDISVHPFTGGVGSKVLRFTYDIHEMIRIRRWDADMKMIDVNGMVKMSRWKESILSTDHLLLMNPSTFIHVAFRKEKKVKTAICIQDVRITTRYSENNWMEGIGGWKILSHSLAFVFSFSSYLPPLLFFKDTFSFCESSQYFLLFVLAFLIPTSFLYLSDSP